MLTARVDGCAARRLIAIATCTLVWASSSWGFLEVYAPLEQILERASVVARIRVLNRLPVAIDVDGTDVACGHRYRAEILRSFKGPSGEIEFVNETDGDFLGLETDYLLLAVDVTESAIIDEVERRGEKIRDRPEIRCRRAHAGLRTFDRQQSLIPFDPSSRGGSEGLLVSRGSVFVESGVEVREVKRFGRQFGRIAWSDALALVDRIHSPPRCGLDESKRLNRPAFAAGSTPLHEVPPGIPRTQPHSQLGTGKPFAFRNSGLKSLLW